MEVFYEVFRKLFHHAFKLAFHHRSVFLVVSWCPLGLNR